MSTLRYGHMVHEHYLARIRAIMEERALRLNNLKTKKDAENYVSKVRAAVKKCFAPFPKRTPLNARTTGIETGKDYTIEKVIYESRPGFLVTGNLYVPANAQGKIPVVLGLCGHSIEGKAAAPYQTYAQGLAARGFMVFIIDPISQGERIQFYPKDGKPVPQLCPGHNLMGNQMSLTGEFFGTWRVWDAIRGLDYLLSHPKADKTRVGVTGNSGGGTLTSYVTALDPRITMAAPSCHISSFLTDFENELPRDAEQNPPGMLAAGLDQVDFLMCYAPRPTIILAQYDDFFDERAAARSYRELRRIHKLLGSKNAEYFAGPDNHGYHQKNREAMYAFFMKHAGIKSSAKEKKCKLLPNEKLFATPKGETHKLGSKRAFEFTAEIADELRQKRGKPSAAQVAKDARHLLKIPASKGTPHYRVLRWTISEDKYGPRPQFAVQTEGGENGIPAIQCVLTRMSLKKAQPERLTRFPKSEVNLYVGNTSGLDDLENLKELAFLREGKVPLFAVDPRGIGEGMSATCDTGKFFSPYNSDYLYAASSEMLGECYMGRRVFDIMRTMDCLLANGVKKINLFGRGLGSMTVSMAALLHPSKPRVRIFNYLPNYHDIIDSPVHNWPLSSFIRNILKHLDLPDIYRALGKRLKKENPWNSIVK